MPCPVSFLQELRFIFLLLLKCTSLKQKFHLVSSLFQHFLPGCLNSQKCPQIKTLSYTFIGSMGPLENVISLLISGTP